jgi:hypothetical protein
VKTVCLETATADAVEIIPAYGSLSYYAAVVDSKISPIQNGRGNFASPIFYAKTQF